MLLLSRNMISCDINKRGALMHNDVSSQRTKQIGGAFHFVREKVAAKVIDTTYVPTGDMVADLLTKALPIAAFTACLKAAELTELTLKTVLRTGECRGHGGSNY